MANGITANVIHRVFKIKYGTNSGTAFTIEVNNLEYVVTAQHVIEGFTGKGFIEIYSEKKWKIYTATLVGHGDGGLDVSVLGLDERLTPSNLPLPASSHGLTYGQDVYFLGFPFGLGDYEVGEKRFPLPFVKKAVVSMFQGTEFFLDGHNNPGFSGGPVVFKPNGQSSYKVAAVISGYRFENKQVLHAGVATPLTVQTNTGIIKAIPIERALDLIKGNPIGKAEPKIE